ERLRGDDRLRARALVAAADAVHLDRRPQPLADERVAAGLAEELAHADLAAVALLVERQGGDRRQGLRARLLDAVVEPGHGDPAAVVQAGEELDEGVERVLHGSAVAAGVEVLARPAHPDL